MRTCGQIKHDQKRNGINTHTQVTTESQRSIFLTGVYLLSVINIWRLDFLMRRYCQGQGCFRESIIVFQSSFG